MYEVYGRARGVKRKAIGWGSIYRGQKPYDPYTIHPIRILKFSLKNLYRYV